MTLWDWVVLLIGPAAYIVGQLWAPRGFWQMGHRREYNPEIGERVKAEQSEEMASIRTVLGAISADGIIATSNQYQLTKLQHAIDYAVQRHDWYEAQRVSVLNSSLTFGGLVLAGLGVFADHLSDITNLQKYVLFGIVITVAIAVILIAFAYQEQLDRDRPYRLVSNVKHWYYRYNISRSATHNPDRLDFVKQAEELLSERLAYVNSLLENFEIVKSVREDLEQLYILHVLQNSKSESLQRMRWMFTYLVSIVFIYVVVYVFVGGGVVGK